MADLSRSLDFYVTALGFEKAERFEIGAPFHIVMELPDTLELTSQFVKKDGVRLEFIEHASPAIIGSTSGGR